MLVLLLFFRITNRSEPDGSNASLPREAPRHLFRGKLGTVTFQKICITGRRNSPFLHEFRFKLASGCDGSLLLPPIFFVSCLCSPSRWSSYVLDFQGHPPRDTAMLSCQVSVGARMGSHGSQIGFKRCSDAELCLFLDAVRVGVCQHCLTSSDTIHVHVESRATHWIWKFLSGFLGKQVRLVPWKDFKVCRREAPDRRVCPINVYV